MSLKIKLALLASVLFISACGDKKEDSSVSPIAVRTTPVIDAAQPLLALSGIVRSEIETPIAFQISGRIAQRLVKAGETVKKGQTLFELDQRDLNQILQATEAEVEAARSALLTAQADTRRNRQLLNEKYISQQGFDRALLQEKEAQTRLDASNSRQQQARIVTEYANLTAPDDGIVTETTGESGQVVIAGQSIGTLAHAGPLEVEVFLPEGFKAPTQGQAQFGNQKAQVTLKEVAGSADPASRTVRARYQLIDLPQPWPLGSVAKVNLIASHVASAIPAAPATKTTTQKTLMTVPIAALDERGQGPQIWIITDGAAQPVAVKLVSLTAETAVIESDIVTGTKVIALGTHLLKPGMAVREIAP